jgi:hypothetical protein
MWIGAVASLRGELRCHRRGKETTSIFDEKYQITICLVLPRHCAFGSSCERCDRTSGSAFNGP